MVINQRFDEAGEVKFSRMKTKSMTTTDDGSGLPDLAQRLEDGSVPDSTAEDPHRWRSLLADMEAFVKANRCFLRPRFSLLDLSLEMSVPQYLLSRAINRAADIGFSAWINRFRIDHFLELYGREEVKSSSLYELATASGFMSKAAFINAFKKEKGNTPGVYVKRMLSQEGGPGGHPGND